MTRKRNVHQSAKESCRLGGAPMSPSTSETAQTLALHRRLKASIAKLEQVDPESDLLTEYRVMNAQIIGNIRVFRAHAELALRRARTIAERKAAAEYLHLVVLAESEFTSGVELAN
jgi:hypothetical protein